MIFDGDNTSASTIRLLHCQFQAMTETPYEQYPTMICLDLYDETRVFAAIPGNSVGRKTDQCIPEFGHSIFREAPFNGLQVNVLTQAYR